MLGLGEMVSAPAAGCGGRASWRWRLRQEKLLSLRPVWTTEAYSVSVRTKSNHLNQTSRKAKQLLVTGPVSVRKDSKTQCSGNDIAVSCALHKAP